MLRASHAAAAAIAIALAAGSIVGCADGDSSDGTAAAPGEVAADASNSADRKIATDLQKYLDRLTGELGRGDLLAAYCGKDESPKQQRICDGARSTLDAVSKLTRIEVSDGAITLHTQLANDEPGRLGAQELCGEIQGADVADFTAGHKVLDDSGDLLLACPTRDQIDSGPSVSYFGE